MGKVVIPNFDMSKLPEYIEEFFDKKVAIIGCGAVGSYLAEILAKQGIIHLTLIDMDRFERTNIAKSSLAFKVNKDEGKNKALALADNLNEMLGDDFVHGIDSDITNFGPMAFADHDVIILALDNYGAKVYCNQIWLQIPKEKRPLLIFGGTIDSSAQSNCIDGNDCCLRCLLHESWLKNPFEKTSCTGINYREPESISEFARTTGGASRLAADFMEEQCAGYLLGYKDMINKRLAFNSYPNFGLMETVPLKRKSCPDCKNYHSVENVEALHDMDVLHSTVGELLDNVSEKLSYKDFEILAPVIEYGNVIYNKIIKDDYCRCCGKELKGLYRHEFRTRYTELLCEECRSSGKQAVSKSRNELIGSFIAAITIDNSDEILRRKTLFEIGFPVGAFIKVKRETGGLSCMDSITTWNTFFCSGDQKLMGMIRKLEG